MYSDRINIKKQKQKPVDLLKPCALWFQLIFDISAISAYVPDLCLYYLFICKSYPTVFIHNLCQPQCSTCCVSMPISYPPTCTNWEGIVFSKVKRGWIWHLTSAAYWYMFGLCSMLLFVPTKFSLFFSVYWHQPNSQISCWLLTKGRFQKRLQV